MRSLFALILFIHSALSCKNEDIITKEIQNYNDIVGNWSLVYHWDESITLSEEFTEGYSDHYLTNCPIIRIEPASDEIIYEKMEECMFQAPNPFEWREARYKITAEMMSIKDGLIFIGENENLMMVNCFAAAKLSMKQALGGDYMVMYNPSIAHTGELLAKRQPTQDAVKCVARNLDLVKNIKGISMCY